MKNKHVNLEEFEVEQLEQRLEMRDWDLPDPDELDDVGKPKPKEIE